MKHVIILLVIAVTVAACSHRASRYGYEPSSQAQATDGK